MTAKLWLRNGKLVVDADGKPIDCPDCPCEDGVPGDDCVHCDPLGSTPREIAITITGVVGCNGRCAPHNLTVVLTQVSTCIWSASNIFAQPTEAPGSPCESLVGNVLGSAEILLTGPGQFELRIFDEVIGGQLVEVFCSGTFSGRCDALSTVASGLTINTYGTMAFACPEAGCEDWCDWSGASVSISAV